jgi:hypothetical protein
MDISSTKKIKSKTSRKYRRAVREISMDRCDGWLCVGCWPAIARGSLPSSGSGASGAPLPGRTLVFSFLSMMTNRLIIIHNSSSSAPYQTTKTLTMATSMAAAIAASLPAPQAASAPAAPVHEPIPASMSKLIDMEAEISLNSVQLEGLVRPAVVAPHFA